MSDKKSTKNSYIFIDLKASGHRPTIDRITEIAVCQFDEQNNEKIWQQAILLADFIPDCSLAKKAVSFQEIAAILATAFGGRILVSTQGRIKYALLKNEMKRAGIEWSAKILCVNQLLNFLEGLRDETSINKSFVPSDCIVTNVKNIARNFTELRNKTDEKQFSTAIKQQIKRNAIPLRLAKNIDAIPEGNGIYQFYSETNALLYIGKSTSLKKRVMSHFSGDYNNNREMQLTQQTKAITWIKTCGELGALLKEAQLIKSHKPIFNRLLRRYRDLFNFQVYQNFNKYSCIQIMASDKSIPLGIENSFGLFKRKSIAKQKLQEIIRKYQLCPKLAGLETGKGACFLYHIQRCFGACVGKESIDRYNERVHEALQVFNYKAWPFSDRITIKETCPVTGENDYHLVDNWCYLATLHDEQEITQFKITDAKLMFDLDIYKILTAFILNKKNVNLISLSQR